MNQTNLVVENIKIIKRNISLEKIKNSIRITIKRNVINLKKVINRTLKIEKIIGKRKNSLRKNGIIMIKHINKNLEKLIRKNVLVIFVEKNAT
jgi:aromatic ring hydroxylase